MVPMNNLCTVRIGSITRAGRVEGDDIVVLDAADVGAVLRTGKQEETDRQQQPECEDREQ